MIALISLVRRSGFAALSSLVLAANAHAQCVPDGDTIECSPDGREMLVEFSEDYADSDGQLYWYLDGPLRAFNAGVITSPSVALDITATGITYVGVSTARLQGIAKGLFLRAEDGFADISVAHDIAGETAFVLEVAGGSAPTIDVKFTGGHVEGSFAGVSVTNATVAPINLLIGADAKITSPIAIHLLSTSGSHVVLAGEIKAIDASGQASVLTEGNDILELHPDYLLEGVIDGRTGTNELRLGGAGTGTFDLGAYGGAFQNFSSFTKTGTSTWTLHGVKSSPVDLDIQSGIIDITGVLNGGGTFTVRDGATLAGTGTLADVDVFGTLAPGSFSAGTLTAMNVAFHPDSILEVEIGAGGLDRLEVGAVTIADAILRVVPSSAADGRYDIVHSASPIAGDFSEVVSNSPRYSVSAVESLDGTLLSVDLERTGVSFSSYATSPDQAAVAALLDQLGEGAPYYAQLDGMDPAAAAELMGQMAGSGFAATSGALLQQSSSLSNASLGRIQQQASALGPSVGPVGYTGFSTGGWYDGLHPNVWGRLIAGTSTIGGSVAGSAALVGGADVELGDDWTLGMLAALGSAAITAGNASTTSLDTSVGIYGSKDFGSLALRFGGSLTHHGVNSRRRVTAPGVDETLTASYGALTAQAFAEVAQEFDLGPVGIELFGDLVYAKHFSPGFTETGGAGALTVASSSSDAVDTTLGVRLSHQVAMGTRLLTVGSTLGWKHRFTATPTTYNSFGGVAPFPVAGISTAGSSLVAGVDLRLDLDEQSGLDVAYDLEWGGSGIAHAISAKYARMF